ncbi:MAG: phospholipase D-like domain-containing protein [Cyanobacteria bacterium J06621_8]
MRYFRVLLLGLVLVSGCGKNPEQIYSSLPQDQFIQVYFNHRLDETNSYQEPYRQLERSGDNLESIITEEIATAKRTIDLAVQELNLPLVAQALVKSHRSGVKVRVILDNNYSRSLSTLNPTEIAQLNQRDHLKYQQFQQLVDVNQDGQLSAKEIAQRDAISILKQAGVPLIDDTADGSKGSGLMHHKFMVVDGQTIITGSANFTLSGIHGDLDNLATRGNVNHLLRINNSQLADLFTEEFNYMWGNSGNPQFGLAKPWRSPQEITWENTQVTIQFAPTSKKRDWQLSTNGLIAETLAQASQSIDLALFVFSEQKLADVLQQKSQQGLEIQGVFDSGFAFRDYSEVLDLKGVTLPRDCQIEANNNPWSNPLGTIGIPLLVSGDKLHHKFSVIDQQLVISGSHNWSYAANQNNDETLMIIRNQTVAQQFMQEFDRLYDSADFELPSRIKSKVKAQLSQCK